MSNNHQQAMNNLENLQRSLGSNALSGVSVTSERGQEVLANLIAEATAPDFDADVARVQALKSLGLSLGR
ncbi:hypothetical protein [Pseudomonas aeruginosa]|uniref:hypothetical protein n=1 Tax=Pseudomonas aeruginosa TaxID=287 RepID=UPI002237DBC1|nr:hypothetical protein [Pseudomonas aeruginosa]MCW4649216.1 hypothetical protein [Pseudomonas aeruginosa]